MPALNTLKKYVSGGFYHIYNRGVEKRDIFLDKQDYKIFLHYLKIYLSPKDKIIEEIKLKQDLSDKEKLEDILKIMKMNNFYNKIQISCFVLMSNHFHLLLKQKENRDIENFMRSLLTKYSKYFNEKYKRVGPLFQSRYKGILITKEEYFLHLSRYIHLNPLEVLSNKDKLSNYYWSSYPVYLGIKNIDWLNKDLILSYFKEKQGFGFSSYQGFVEGYKNTLFEKSKLYKELILE